MWPITVLILILWPIFYSQEGEVLWQVWRVRITTQSLWQGLSTALRVDALAFAFLVLLFSTDQARLVRGLVKLGLPYEWGLTLAIALRYLPTLYGIYITVSEAQQARGWVVGEGNFVRRIKSYLPILVAVIVTALRLADNLSLALAARGFQPGTKRTYLRDLKLGSVDKVCLSFLAASLIVFLIVRFRHGLGTW
jgi:energy-coupling factor transport system permease protein